MAWLEGTAEREFEVEAPVERVAEFFADPGQFEHCVQDLDSLERIDEDVWQFTLEELSAKGVSFQGEYQVAYSRDGSEVTWEPTDADKNMKSEGRVTVEDLGGGRS
ncbi:MAG: SRPBCC domain-containing protein, partial [Bradymonadaceae bacterium]